MIYDQTNEAIKIDTFGSCVSRDIFRFTFPGRYQIEKSIQRNPISLIGSPPFPFQENEFPCNLPPYEKRMVYHSLRKDALDSLMQSNAQWLILDLGEERFDKLKVFFFDQREGCTYLASYRKGKKDIIQSFLSSKSNCKFVKVPYNQIPWERVECAYTTFLKRILQKYQPDHIIIVEAFLSEEYITADGTIGKFKSYGDIGHINAWLEQLYHLLYRLLAQLTGKKEGQWHRIQKPSDTLSSPTHLWGLHPFHYGESYYKYCSDLLDIITKNCMTFTAAERLKEQCFRNRMAMRLIHCSQMYEMQKSVQALQAELAEQKQQTNAILSSLQASSSFEHKTWNEEKTTTEEYKSSAIGEKIMMDNGTVLEKVTESCCTGCGACFAACPTNAISMKPDKDGFLSPEIDWSQCVRCGKCVKTCPALKQPSFGFDEPDCYATWASDEIREQSSSGGMFTVLANYVLERNGSVCGVVWDENWNAQHCLVDQSGDISPMRFSKYVQSSTENTFREIKHLLEQGRYVLFSGTPCQISGLNSYLQKKHDTLITVDLVCHGAPSPKAFQLYLKEKSQDKTIANINFREKLVYGWSTPIAMTFSDGSVYRNDCFHDPYWVAFLNGISTRLCCGECPYASHRRVGDFTIGDFWGIREYDPSLDDAKGTGLTLVNSKKGRNIYKQLLPQLRLSQKVPFEAMLQIAKKRNGQLITPKKASFHRKQFFSLLDIKPFSAALDEAQKRKFDVGLFGWWYNENYGGTLTYYALHQILRKMGLSVLMIDKPSSEPGRPYPQDSIPRRFASKHYSISNVYHPDKLGELNNYCEMFVSGSDQLFAPWAFGISGSSAYLDFASPTKNLVSYASSFGNSYQASLAYSMKISYWLNRFSAVSVREDYAIDICRDYFGIEATHVLDPVFLCDPEEYEQLIGCSKEQPPEHYLLNFILDPDEDKRRAIESASKRLGLDYVNLIHACDFENNKKKLGLKNIKENADVEDWLNYYKHAGFIITDSFHGTCFAILFRKPFISIANLQRGDKRFVSLLTKLGLMDRLVYNAQQIAENGELFRPIDYDKVYEILNEERDISFNWLKNALFHPFPKSSRSFHVLDKKMNEQKQTIIRLQQIVSELKKEVETLKQERGEEQHS